MVQVINILCFLHLARNLSNNIKAVSKTKGGVGTEREQKLEKTSKEACDGIKSLVEVVSKMDLTGDQKYDRLANNIRMLKYHLIGNHDECATPIDDEVLVPWNDFGCNGVTKLGEKDFMLNLISKRLLVAYKRCFLRVENAAKDLLLNLTTNRSESFNALIVKTIEAKRVDFSRSRQYNARCHLAVLSQNENETFASVCKQM